MVKKENILVTGSAGQLGKSIKESSINSFHNFFFKNKNELDITDYNSLDKFVKNNRIISDGYNGTPSGFENFCEDEDGYTKWYVLHAEANAITKVASSTQSCDGATLYITLSPCKQCSKLIYQAKIKRLVYAVQYKDTSGIEFLKKAGVIVDHIKI